MIQALCGKCGRDLKAVNSARTKFLQCPNCGTSFIIKSIPEAKPRDGGNDIPTVIEGDVRLLQDAPVAREITTARPPSHPVVASDDVEVVDEEVTPEVARPPARRRHPLVAFLVFTAAVSTIAAVLFFAVAAPFGSDAKKDKTPADDQVAEAQPSPQARLPLPPPAADDEVPFPAGSDPEAARYEEEKRSQRPDSPPSRPGLPEVDANAKDLPPPRPPLPDAPPPPRKVIRVEEEDDTSPAKPIPPQLRQPAPPQLPPTAPAKPAPPPTAPAKPVPPQPAPPQPAPPQTAPPQTAPTKPALPVASQPVATRPNPKAGPTDGPPRPVEDVPGVVREAAAFTLPPAGGAAVLNDGKTLVVSAPAQAALIYIDTAINKEIKRVELDFAPTALAVQDNQLVAGTRGASSVQVLAAATGKPIRTIKVPGEQIKALACNPHKGYVYGINTADEVIVIDPAEGTAKKTHARGHILAVGAADSRYVYTGIYKPIRSELVFHRNGNQVTLSKKPNINGALLKFEVQGNDLAPIAFNDSAAIFGRCVAVSPDGKLAALVGSGGWRPKSDQRVSYCIAVYETADLKTTPGQVDTEPYPTAMAFHPTLSMGAVFNGGVLSVFSSKSFTKKDSFRVQQPGGALFVGFGGYGSKVIYCPESGPKCIVEVIPFNLADGDKAALKEAVSVR
jgi:hypothetical protein